MNKIIKWTTELRKHVMTFKWPHSIEWYILLSGTFYWVVHSILLLWMIWSTLINIPFHCTGIKMEHLLEHWQNLSIRSQLRYSYLKYEWRQASTNETLASSWNLYQYRSPTRHCLLILNNHGNSTGGTRHHRLNPSGKGTITGLIPDCWQSSEYKYIW